MSVISRSAARISLALLACCFALPGSLGCCKSNSSDSPSGSNSAASTATSRVVEDAAKPLATAAPAVMACTKFATLDSAPKPRPPILSSVKGARVPAGGTPKAKKPELFSIDYWSPDTPKVEIACTVRKQLEDDKWTIESMSGASVVVIVARKGSAAIQVMVGPGTSDAITTVILSQK